jgi:hypothetical protein
MTKVRVRKLWLKVYFDVPKDVPLDRIKRTLIRSIRRGDYKIPRGWRAVIEWKNYRDAQPRRGEWRAELEASASGPEGSKGFEKAVIMYLENAQ